MVKTMKIAGVSAAVLASVCSFAVLANPSQVRAEGGCNATPSVQDFSAYYYDESVNKAHVEYTGEMPLCDGATMTFSLNSYSDEGAEWETSGNQKFVDHATVVLTNEKTSADLEVKLPEGDDCFFQTDLYSNGKKYDGVDGPLPHYPDTEAPDDYIDSRSGGSNVCTGGNGGGEPTPTPSVESASVLPDTGAELGNVSGLLALGAGMTGGTVAYLRSRRTR